MKKIFYLAVLLLPLIVFSRLQGQPVPTGVFLGPDFNLCAGYMHQLDAGPGFDSYLWQDGSTSQFYMVTEPGTYWAHGFVGSTMYGDTINIGYWPYPDPNLGNDTIICAGSELLLEATSGFAEYIWQDGSTLPYFEVTTGGTYYVTVTDIHGCVGSDTIYIEYTEDNLYLGMDTMICDISSVLLDAGEGYSSYLWQDGSTDQYFYVDGAAYGIGSHYFWVTVLDTTNCESSDTILIYISQHVGINKEESKGMQVYPNPGNDLINISLNGISNTIQSIIVFNTIGEAIYSIENRKFYSTDLIQLKTAGFTQGVYYVKVRTEKKEYTGKLLIR